MTPAMADPNRMPIFASVLSKSLVNARFAMNNDIVKPMPPRIATP